MYSALFIYVSENLVFQRSADFWNIFTKAEKTENREIFKGKMFCLLLKIVGIIAKRKHRFNSRQNAVTENYNTRKKS